MTQNPSFATASSPAPDNLIAGTFPRETESVTIKSGQNITRGTVVGRITMAGATSAAKAGGNTGNGTCTVDVTTPVLTLSKPGVWTVRNVLVAANLGKFEVRDPDGLSRGVVDVAGTFANGIKFALADGSTDFVLGDGFDITVAAGSGKYIKSLSAAVDGSQDPCGVLVDDVDASSGDVAGSVYRSGDFNKTALTFGTGHSATTQATIDALRAHNIHLKSVVA